MGMQLTVASFFLLRSHCSASYITSNCVTCHPKADALTCSLPLSDRVTFWLPSSSPSLLWTKVALFFYFMIRTPLLFCCPGYSRVIVKSHYTNFAAK